jgi:hypothetical protein
MNRGAYHIVCETTEDRFDEVDTLEQAIRIARDLVKEGQPGDPISIEHNGRVIHQLVLTTDGKVKEEPIC